MSRNEADQGQPSTRRAGVVYDQHAFPGHKLFSRGRPWGCSIDKKSGFPVGVIQPQGWRAPWIPPQNNQTFQFDENDPTRLRLNYEYLLDERVAATEEYDQARQKAALTRGWDPRDPEKVEALDSIVGSRDDLQYPEVVVACMQGDPWILGATETVNVKLLPFIKQRQSRTEKILAKYPDFTAQDSEGGIAEGPNMARDEYDVLLDLEEEHDPAAVGGKRVKVKSAKQTTKVA